MLAVPLPQLSLEDLKAVTLLIIEQPAPDVRALLEIAAEYRRRELFSTEDTVLRIAARAQDAELPWLLG